MRYGLQIGNKFNKDGTPKLYPGNTVVADVEKDNPAYGVVQSLREELERGDLGNYFIFMPGDSYHVTVIRGMNDLVREPDFWPQALDRNAPMTAVDDYFEGRVKGIPRPDRFHMRFDRVKIDDYDVRICLKPWDAEQESRLRSYRDQVADALGLRLPGHDTYTYHITLAYVRIIPEGEAREEMDRRVQVMDDILKGQEGFWLSDPRISFYEDMLNFYPNRIPRT